jgi:hypothetical protein
MKISIDRLADFKEPIELKVAGLPTGISVTGTAVSASQSSAELTFTAAAGAKIQLAHLSITGIAAERGKGSGRDLAHRAAVRVPRGQPALADVLLMVAMPTPFVIKGEYDMGFAARGSVQKRQYKIVRNGYDGSIEVSLADRQARHLQGVTGPTVVVPAGVSEFSYEAMLPPWMETGRTCRVCVMGVGTVKEANGTEHSVSFSSVSQNEQLVAVVGPGKLALELERSSFIARPGEVIAIPLRIKRSLELSGPVQLDLIFPPHVKGLSAEPATIAAGHERGELIIHCAHAPLGPFNMPVIVRATLTLQGQPYIAEAILDIRP